MRKATSAFIDSDKRDRNVSNPTLCASNVIILSAFNLELHVFPGKTLSVIFHVIFQVEVESNQTFKFLF